jgi:(p)ppGpp synthase/HD superfamily hydrolase
MHADQRRRDEAPFILHPLEVAELLSSSGYDDDLVTAGVLHDLVENTDATIAEVRERFGDPVARLVAAATEDTTITAYGAPKAALRDQSRPSDPRSTRSMPPIKVCKVRELRAQPTRDPCVLEH